MSFPQVGLKTKKSKYTQKVIFNAPQAHVEHANFPTSPTGGIFGFFPTSIWCSTSLACRCGRRPQPGESFFAVEEMLRQRLLGMMIPSLWTQSHPENGRGTINTMGFGGAWTPLAHHLRNMTGCQGYSYYRYYLPAG